MDRHFTIVIEPCTEGGYYAECPSLPGCHVQGDTYEEVMTEVKAAVQAMLEDYKASGEPLPEDQVTVASLKIAV